MQDLTFTRDRRRMVQDLADRGIEDRKVLDAMGAVPRERFVGLEIQHLAYADRPLPIEGGQTISQPYIVAKTIEAMRVGPADRVLDVGTGSGYAAAVLALLAGEVWSIERLPELARRAQQALRDLELDVEVVVGDGSLGLPEHAPWSAIGVAAASPSIPYALVDQLVDGGRLVIPVGVDGGWQELQAVTREGDDVRVESLGGVRFVPLVGEDANPS